MYFSTPSLKKLVSQSKGFFFSTVTQDGLIEMCIIQRFVFKHNRFLDFSRAPQESCFSYFKLYAQKFAIFSFCKTFHSDQRFQPKGFFKMIGKIVLINFFVEKKIVTTRYKSKLMKNRIVLHVKNLRSVYINLKAEKL